MSAAAVTACAASPAIAAALREPIFTGLIQIQHIIGQDLRGFLFLKVQRTADRHHIALVDRAQTAFIHIREHHDLGQSEQVFQIQERHHLAALGDQRLFTRDHAAHDTLHTIMDLAVLIMRETMFHRAGNLITAVCQTGLPGGKMRDVIPGQRTDLFHLFFIAVERVIGQIHAQHFLFHFQLDVLVERRHVRQPATRQFRLHAFSRQIKERHLPFNVLLGGILC